MRHEINTDSWKHSKESSHSISLSWLHRIHSVLGQDARIVSVRSLKRYKNGYRRIRHLSWAHCQMGQITKAPLLLRGHSFGLCYPSFAGAEKSTTESPRASADAFGGVLFGSALAAGELPANG